MYRRDKNIPPHGRRAKADNVGNVRVRISSMSGKISRLGDEFDIFPDNAMLDGDVASIQVRSDFGCLSIDSNMLERTLRDGWILTTKMNFHTPFHRLAALAFEALGIDPYEGVTMLID